MANVTATKPASRTFDMRKLIICVALTTVLGIALGGLMPEAVPSILVGPVAGIVAAYLWSKPHRDAVRAAEGARS